MTRKPATGTARTNPPDRDGNGAPGGSLPGNGTVEAAKGPSPDDDDAASREAVEGRNRPVGDEHVHPEPADREDGAAPAPEVSPGAGATEGQAEPAEPEAAEGGALTDPAAAAIESFNGDGGETFSAEEIAAGQTPVIEQEGEAVTTAAEATADAAADLATVEPETPAEAPVAVRLDELERLVSNRWLYKSADGYSPSYAAPYVSHETIRVWLDNGLCEDRPSAGREGGVFLTAKASRAVADGRRAA